MSFLFEIVFKDEGHAGFHVVGRLQDVRVVMGTQKWTYVDVAR